MLSSRLFRLGLAGAGLLVLLSCAWAGWQAWQVSRDLNEAMRHAERFEAALASGDDAVVQRELEEIQTASGEAADRTSGVTWSVLGKLPFLGDDARGVRIASQVIADLAADGLGPLVDVSRELGSLRPRDSVFPIGAIEDLRDPVGRARAAMTEAEAELAREDPDGFIGRLATQYRELQSRVSDAAASLRSAEIAVDILPDMLGASGKRNYLLVFQNNAEIRATGGMPGSWAHLQAEGGKVVMGRQGEAGDFPHAEDPVVDLTDAEVALYGEELGTYFQDAGFTPHFPRAAEIWRAHWDRKFPGTRLDGVLALDPVAMSYLLRGTGPIRVEDRTLTSENVVEELLNKPYLELEPAEQDALFQSAARAIFDAMSSRLARPVAFVEGLRQAAAEGRFLMAPFAAHEIKKLSGTEVLGELGAGSATSPRVAVGFNDATASKMSYYLRYWAEVEAVACRSGAQQLEVRLTLDQSIAPARAAALPDSVTGGGNYGTEPGTQLLGVRVYGPLGGSIERVRVDGREVAFETVEIDGRPASTLVVHLNTRDDVVVDVTMRAAADQTGDVLLRMTPSVLPGDNDARFESAC